MNYFGIACIVISLLLIIFSIFKKENTFFNALQIVKDHFSLFNKSFRQILIFYIYPLLLAIGVTIVYDATDELFDNFLIILSIVISMLFSILAIITNFNYNNNIEKTTKDRIIQVVQESCNSILYSCLICVFLIIYCIILICLNDMSFYAGLFGKILNGIAYYLFVVLILNLLLVMKRISKIINTKIKKESEDNRK